MSHLSKQHLEFSQIVAYKKSTHNEKARKQGEKSRKKGKDHY